MPFALTPERERELDRDPHALSDAAGGVHSGASSLSGSAGFVSEDVIAFVSDKLRSPAAHVKGRRHLLHAVQPAPGRQAPGLGVPHAALRAARRRRDARTTARRGSASSRARPRRDGKVTLRTAECLASCGTAPMMQVDKNYHENLTLPRGGRDPRSPPEKLGRSMLKQTNYLTKVYGLPERLDAPRRTSASCAATRRPGRSSRRWRRPTSSTRRRRRTSAAAAAPASRWA